MGKGLRAFVAGLMVAACATAVVAAPAAGDSGQAQAAKKCKKKKASSTAATNTAAASKKKCKKKAIPPATTPAPGGGTTTPPPPPTYTDTTIYAINDGTVAPGSNVRISDVVVTAKMGDGSAIWVQIKSGDPGSSGSTAYAGLEVSSGAVSLTGIAVGDRVTIEGVSGAHSLTAATLTETGVPTSIEYGSASSTAFVDGSVDDILDGQFVGINTTPIPPAFSGFDPSGWTTSPGFVVGNRIIGTLPSCGAGSRLGLFGIADLVSGDLVLLPRSDADITCLYLLMDPDVCTNSTNSPEGSVSVRGPVASNTTVTMQSSDTGLLTVAESVVTTGNSGVSVQVTTGSSTGFVTVTATLNGVSMQDTIEIVECV